MGASPAPGPCSEARRRPQGERRTMMGLGRSSSPIGTIGEPPSVFHSMPVCDARGSVRSAEWSAQRTQRDLAGGAHAARGGRHDRLAAVAELRLAVGREAQQVHVQAQAPSQPDLTHTPHQGRGGRY